jgi:ribosomal protein S18 acetylase RimI-like enzyme
MASRVRFACVEIRQATRDDLKEIIDIERASFEHEAYSKDLLALFLRDKAFITLVATDGVKLLAYATTLGEDGGSGMRIVSIAVLPERRGQGAALTLMKNAEAIAIEKGAERMSLEVGVTNVPAINLYLKLGFSIKGTIPDYYGEGKDALYMEKHLPPVKSKAEVEVSRPKPGRLVERVKGH